MIISMENENYSDFCPTKCGWIQADHYAYPQGYYEWNGLMMIILKGQIPIYRMWRLTKDGNYYQIYDGPLDETLLLELMKAHTAITEMIYLNND